MEQNRRLDITQHWPVWHARAVLLVFCFFMLCPAAPYAWSDLYSFFYGRNFIIIMLAIFFFICRLRQPAEVRLVVFYAAWLLLTRILNGDLYMTHEPDLVLTKFLCAAMLACGFLLDARQRRRFMNFFCALAGGFYFIFGALALRANLLGTYFYLPPENVLFGLDYPWHLQFVNIFDTNRTISSLWFYIALCLMIYQFFACKNKLWRIPITAAGLLFYVVIALSFARTVKMISAVSFAMLAMLLALKYLPLDTLWKKAAVLLLCAALIIPIGFKSFDWTAGLMSELSTVLTRETGTRENGESAGVDYTDNRDLKQDLSNLSERGQIYASVIPSLKARPKTLFVGNFSDKLMNVPNQFVDFPIPFTHMHNFLLEVLMLTGLPGLLLVLGFCLLLVLRMLHLFFTSAPGAGLAEKALTIPLTGILLYGMFEVVIFTACSDKRAPTDIRELSFFILAGVMLASSHELLPTLRDSRKNR